VTEAIFGLVGVLIGALVTAGVNLHVEHRRERAAAIEAKRRRYAEIAVTCRLVANEIDTIGENFRLLAELKRTLIRPIHEAPGYLPSTEWATSRTKLAGIVADYRAWSEITSVYHNAGGLRARMVADEPGSPLPPERLHVLTRDADAAQILAVVLNAFAQDHLEALEASSGEPAPVKPVSGWLADAEREVARAGSVQAALKGEVAGA
jgi:hypothetical protein